jgi:uncharacterized protein
VKMRLSRYCIVMGDLAGPGQVVVHDILTGTGLLIREEVLGNVQASIDAGHPDALELKRAGLLYDAEACPEGDALRADYWLGKRRMGTSSSFFTYVLTLHCNLRCVYCYQATLSERSRMSAETARAAAAWSIGIGDANRIGEFIAVFFGGEPLLEMEALVEISGRLKAAATARGWSYRALVVTNATLLTPDLAGALCEAGVSGAQITIDGPRDAHDRRRVGAAGEGTFDRVLAGVENCFGKLAVSLRINLDRDNLPLFGGFLPTVAGWKRRGLIANIDLAGVTDPEGNSEYCQIQALSEDDFSETFLPLIEQARLAGVPPASRVLAGPCPALCDGSWVVAPDGDLFRCHHLVGDPRWVCGNVHQGEPNHLYHRFLTVEPRSAECRDCPFMPACYGGCRYRAIVKGKDLSEPDCYRGVYANSVRGLIGASYRGILADRARASAGADS